MLTIFFIRIDVVQKIGVTIYYIIKILDIRMYNFIIWSSSIHEIYISRKISSILYKIADNKFCQLHYNRLFMIIYLSEIIKTIKNRRTLF